MKTKILLICFACFFSWQIRAEINDKIIADGRSWNVLRYPSGGDDRYRTTQNIYFEGDSIIGEHAYKKIYSFMNKSYNDIKHEGLMREENQKIYFIPADFEKEYLLYDFSLEEGMEFEYTEPSNLPNYDVTEPFYIKKIDSIEINGVQKKRFHLTSPPPYDNYIRATWIESIGSLHGPLYSCGPLAPGSILKLLCYHIDDELIYKNPDYSECYYDYSTSIEDVGDAVYSLSPNPVEDILTISSSENILQVDIFDASGKKIYSQLGGNDINMATFIKGIYFVKVYGAMNEARSFKIIKN